MLAPRVATIVLQRSLPVPLAVLRVLRAAIALLTVLAVAVRAFDSVTDRNALSNVYQAMGGAQWIVQTDWLAPNVSMCAWYGVACQLGCPTNSSSVECRVVELNLASNGLVGNIAPAVQQLTNLTKLVLAGNALGGSIPSFSALSALTWLDLSAAQLTGAIPEFDALVNLERIELYDNHLDSELPTFAQSPRLAYVDLEPCYGLFGSIPPSYSALVQLQYLALGHSRLTGTLPPLSALVQLQTLRVFENSLNGTLPFMDTLSQLQTLLVYNNQFTGALPLLTAAVLLREFNAGANMLSGTVHEFTTLVQLESLRLGGNRLTGSVPEFTTLVQLQHLGLDSNALTGSVPQFAANVQLQTLDLSTNQLNGTTPEFVALTQLQQLSLNNNNLSGTAPEFAALTQLQLVWLNDNRLVGAVPSYATLTQLQFLGLGNNRFSGPIPNFTANVQLQTLHLFGNRLTGEVPALDTLTQLQSLDVSNNLLSGRAPTLENNTALRRLNLGTNSLSGSMPLLGSLAQLSELRVARNQFTGAVPFAWRALRALAFVDAAENALDGDLRLFQLADALPPLSAAFVNLSFNRLGGALDALPPPERLNLTSIDIRFNRLLCPYPQFPVSIRVLRSECANDWAQLGVYAGVGAAVVAVALVVFLVVKYCILSDRALRIALFAVSWLVSVVGIVSDANAYTVMVAYLQTRSRNCDSINEWRVFYPQLQDNGNVPPSVESAAGAFSFSNWIAPNAWSAAFVNGLAYVRTYTETFASACRQARECDYDAVAARCVNAFPERAASGGGAHESFFIAVLVFIAIRVAYEAFCALIVLVSCARNALVLNCHVCCKLSARVWIKSSALMPLLLLRAATRDTLVAELVLGDTRPTEYVWALLSKGVFVTGVQLFAQLYYLLRVAQTGLAWSNWLSLALGIVTVPRLVAQAAWSWHKLRTGASDGASTSTGGRGREADSDAEAEAVEAGADRVQIVSGAPGVACRRPVDAAHTVADARALELTMCVAFDDETLVEESAPMAVRSASHLLHALRKAPRRTPSSAGRDVT